MRNLENKCKVELQVHVTSDDSTKRPTSQPVKTLW